MISRNLNIILAIFISLSMGYCTMHGQIIGLDLLKSNEATEVPFKIEQGFIVVDVWLEGIIPLKMIFDTGAENTILFDKEITTLMGVQYERQIPIMGSDLDSAIIANIARNVTLRLAGCNKVKRDIIVLEDNDLLLREKLGIQMNGILGGNFFSNLVVKIDYKKKVIRFIHPSDFDPPKYYEEFDLTIFSNKPYLDAAVDIGNRQNTSAKFLLDTGSALPFLLHANTDTSLSLPNRIMVGNLGYGISGVLMGFRGIVDRLQFGSFKFDQITTSFQDLNLDSTVLNRPLIRNGILGNALLARFHVIIDYTKEKLYLRPLKRYNEKFDYDKSGLSVFAVGQNLDQYYVVSVITDSPGGRAGILPGDIIHKMGRRRTRSMTLQQINYKLSRKAGKKIRMIIIRDDLKIEKKFLLKEWFQDRDTTGI